jgi:hypothetical protein
MSDKRTVRLTLIYEKKVSAEDIADLKEAVSEYDEQMLAEEFGIGWDLPAVKALSIKHRPSCCDQNAHADVEMGLFYKASDPCRCWGDQ